MDMDFEFPKAALCSRYPFYETEAFFHLLQVRMPLGAYIQTIQLANSIDSKDLHIEYINYTS